MSEDPNIVVATLNTPKAKQKVTLRHGTDSRELEAETVIKIYQPVEDYQIRANIRVKSVLPGVCQENVSRHPEHVCLLLEQIQQICQTNNQFARITGLLLAYADVFSRRDNNVGRKMLWNIPSH